MGIRAEENVSGGRQELLGSQVGTRAYVEDNPLRSASMSVEPAPDSPAERAKALGPHPTQKEILSLYKYEEQVIIFERVKQLEVLAKFIGRDFEMPVRLGSPGTGWCWDAVRNRVMVDPDDILAGPMDRLRFIISHEGGHRRITRMDEKILPDSLLKQTGFHYMWNALEDCRMNNFVAQGDPAFKAQMRGTYLADWESSDAKVAQLKAEGRLARVPLSVVASYEYLHQWFEAMEGRPMVVKSELPAPVQECLRKTLPTAERIWNCYPSIEQADEGEAIIRRYAKHSIDVMVRGYKELPAIWPEIQKLVENDLKDQELHDQLNEMAGNKKIPAELAEQLSPDQLDELLDAIDNAGDSLGGDPLEGMSPELRGKIQEYLDNLPDEKKRELREQAEAALKRAGDALLDELEGPMAPPGKGEGEHMSPAPGAEPVKSPADDQPASEGASEDPVPIPDAPAPPSKKVGARPEPANKEPKKEPGQPEREPAQSVEEYEKLVKEVIGRDGGTYQKLLTSVAPMIRELEREFRGIFIERSRPKREAGRREGETLNVTRRIEEIGSKVRPEDSRAWERETRPTQRDYSITLMIDLSSSMYRNIENTLMAAILVAEVLGKFGIRTEVLGFNAKLHVFKKFSEPMGNAVRERMATMLDEVNTEDANYNDDGWAIGNASARLAEELTKEKILIAFSDGRPVPSPQHQGARWELRHVISEVLANTDQKLIGLGVGMGTGHVKNYYPHSRAEIPIDKLVKEVASILREVIKDYEKFKR